MPVVSGAAILCGPGYIVTTEATCPDNPQNRVAIGRSMRFGIEAMASPSCPESSLFPRHLKYTRKQ